MRPTGPMRFEPGDQIVAFMAGGGGFGDPLEREPERVLSDVRNEYVSLESAEKDYGVVIHHPAPRKWILDLPATERLREEIRSQKSEISQLSRSALRSAGAASDI
jgi:N-methylhydantoinase B